MERRHWKRYLLVLICGMVLIVAFVEVAGHRRGRNPALPPCRVGPIPGTDWVGVTEGPLSFSVPRSYSRRSFRDPTEFGIDRIAKHNWVEWYSGQNFIRHQWVPSRSANANCSLNGTPVYFDTFQAEGEVSTLAIFIGVTDGGHPPKTLELMVEGPIHQAQFLAGAIATAHVGKRVN